MPELLADIEHMKELVREIMQDILPDKSPIHVMHMPTRRTVYAHVFMMTDKGKPLRMTVWYTESEYMRGLPDNVITMRSRNLVTKEMRTATVIPPETYLALKGAG